MRHVLRVLAALAVAGLAFLLWSAWDRGVILALKREAQPLHFFAAMAVLPALGIPITPFFIVSGALFGTALGTFGSLVAMAANLALCYWLAHSALRPRLRSLLERFGYELPDFQERKRGALHFTLMVKFTPLLPAFVKNYALGLTGVPFGVYFGVSMAVTGSVGAALIVLGGSLFEHDLTRVAAVIAVGLMLLIALLWWRRRSGAKTPQTRASQLP